MIRRLQEEVARMRLDAGMSQQARGKAGGSRKKQSTALRNALPLASGLIPSSKSFKPSTASRQTVTNGQSPAVVGGLTNDDLIDVPPLTARVSSAPRLTEDDLAEKMSAIGRDIGRKNTLVTPQVQAPAIHAPRRNRSIRTAHTGRSTAAGAKPSSKASIPSMSPTVAVHPSSPVVEASSRTPVTPTNAHALSASITDTHSNDTPTTAGKTRKTHLPQFVNVGNRWEDVCLPSLYAVVWVSQNPFADFKINTATLQGRVQRVIDTVYTNVDYSLHEQDPILLLAHKRILSKRGEIASVAVDLLVKEVKSLSSATQAAHWLDWSQRLTGPLYFEHPTPASCRVSWDHPAFKPPRGRMKSPILVALVRKFLLASKNAVVVKENAHQRPVGLVALAMAALHRAARFVQPNGDVSPDITPFSGNKVNAMVEKFMGVAQGVTSETWDQFLELCDVPITTEEEHNADASFDDLNCHRMYMFQSPKKSSSSGRPDMGA